MFNFKKKISKKQGSLDDIIQKMKGKTALVEKTKRFFWADVIRVSSIFLVILLHVNSLPQTTFVSSVVHAIAQTSVPLFIILSGVLLLKKNESHLVFFKKRFSKIVYPWIFWTTIYFFLHLSFQYEMVQSVGLLKSFYELFFSGFWFLPLIASIYFFTPLLRIFVQHAKRRDIILGVFLWFVYASLFPFFQLLIKSGLPYNNSAVQYIGYFIVGLLLIKITPSRKNVLVLLAFFVTSLLVTFFSELLPFGKELAAYPYIFLSPFSVINSLLVFSLLYVMSIFWEKRIPKMVSNTFTLMSRATLGIYLSHFIVMELFYKNINNFVEGYLPMSLASVFIKTGIVFIASFICIFLLQKVPWLKKVVA